MICDRVGETEKRGIMGCFENTTAGAVLRRMCKVDLRCLTNTASKHTSRYGDRGEVPGQV